MKICGLRRAEDARLAAELGAAFLGFVFAPSPRRADPSALSAWLPDFKKEFPSARTVGVFVRPEEGSVRECVDTLGLDFIQVHLADRGFAFDPQRRIEARSSEDLEGTGGWGLQPVTGQPPFAWLIDTPSEQGGGTGRVFDWSILESDDRPGSASSAPGPRIFLAGGLGPDNVGEAIERVRPYAVDASSRLESEPGRKDRQLLLRYFEEIRRVDEPVPADEWTA